MIRNALAVAALVAIVTCTPATASGPETSFKAVIQGRYDALKVTMQARDRKGMAAFFDPGFESADPGEKRMTLKDMVEGLPTTPPDPSTKSGTTVLSAERKGDTATVVTLVHGTMTTKEADGSLVPREWSAISTDTWVLAHGRWLYKHTTTDTIDIKVNGVLVMHKKFPPT